MRQYLLPVIAALALGAGMAQAAETLFTYDTLSHGLVDDGTVSNYMSGLYGSPVLAWGPEIRGDYPGGFSEYGSDKYIWNRALSGGLLAVTFLSEPVQCVNFQGHVFDATSGADFTFKAYANTWDAIKDIWKTVTPLYSQSWNAGIGPASPSGKISLPGPAYCLVFTNEGTHDIGIDDLCVEKCVNSAVPAPGALLLASLGTVVVGWLRKRKCL